MRLQRTIRQSAKFRGKGIHTGREVSLAVHGAAEDSGLVFTRVDLDEKVSIRASVENLCSDAGGLRCTCIEKSGARVMTVEHILAALNSLNIDNAAIEIDSEELPALDGSALEYANAFTEAGTIEQKSERPQLALKEMLSVKDDKAILLAVPSDRFSVSYALDFLESGITQFAEFAYKNDEEKEELFKSTIAPARTFCRESEVAGILESGLGKGGDYSNTLVIKDGRPVNNEYRMHDEPAHHKILDILGDLALLNKDIKAHIIAVKSGHALNLELVRRLYEVL